MLKKLIASVLVLALMAFSFPVLAAQKTDDKTIISTNDEIIYEETFEVVSKPDWYQVGFALIRFPNMFIEEEIFPMEISVSIYAENGTVMIEFSPDIPDFQKKVHIKVDSYEGYIYDVATGQNIYVKIKKQHLKLDHFSRYAFI